jgi:hypothetical protein
VASGTRVKIENNFPKVKQASTKTVVAARDLALKIGEKTARAKLNDLNSSRDYHLPDSVGVEKTSLASMKAPSGPGGSSSGTLFLGQPDEFWWRFFEYGTVHITAFPMIRPAGRAMNIAFQSVIIGQLDKEIARRAKVKGS